MNDFNDLILALQKFAPKEERLDAKLAFKSFDELEADYVEYIKKSDLVKFDLGRWLPSIRQFVRPLVPGEFAVILADTGVGKTAILQNLIMASTPLPTALFEIELPSTLMFERFLSLQEKRSGQDIEEMYKKGIRIKPSDALKNIQVCPYSKIDVHDIEGLINSYSDKTGVRPVVVFVDYIGLIGSKGNSRYERMSYIAEQLKIIAKATDTIIISSCQIHRKSEDSASEVSLHDAKDSGSIENSSGLVLGVWREGPGGETMKVRILKNTKGSSGATINAKFKGDNGLIYE